MPKAKPKPKAKAPPVVTPAPLPDFDVPDIQAHPEWPLLTRRQFCARWKVGDVSRFAQRRAIIQSLWHPADYEMHFWSDRRLRSVCEHDFVIWMGPASSGKTTDAAAIALAYWLEAPWETAVIVCSTTKDMLRKRIWGQIARLWNRLPAKIPYKGVMTDANCTIRWEDSDMVNAIMGVAVADGPVEEAINNLIGIHTKRVLLVLDEMQGVREAIMGALPNMAKNPESKFLGMGNPTSMMSMLCKYAEPLGGWGSVIRGETPDWPISEGEYQGTGRALFFDGRKSPAVLDPEWGRRNSWMINRAQVDKAIATKGENHPEVWTMTIGWPPPVGTDNTVLDVQIIEAFRCREKAIWSDGYMTGAALDPAFVEGGDSKILQFFKYGRVNDELGSRWVIELGEWLEVPIDASEDADFSTEYQIVYYCRERCQSKGIKPADFGVDMTGIGRGLKMIFDKEWGSCAGIEFGGNPTDLPVGETGKTAKEVFDRRSSELNIMIRYFANSHGLRGISKEVEEQACQRKTFQKIKHMVETKEQMKKRTGRSPDHCDAAAIAVDMCRQRGAYPGDFVAAAIEPERNLEQARKEEHYFSEDRLADHNEWQQDYAGML